MRNSLGDLLLKAGGVLLAIFVVYSIFGVSLTSVVVGIVILAIFRLGL